MDKLKQKLSEAEAAIEEFERSKKQQDHQIQMLEGWIAFKIIKSPFLLLRGSGNPYYLIGFPQLFCLSVFSLSLSLSRSLSLSLPSLSPLSPTSPSSSLSPPYRWLGKGRG